MTETEEYIKEYMEAIISLHKEAIEKCTEDILFFRVDCKIRKNSKRVKALYEKRNNHYIAKDGVSQVLEKLNEISLK